ncbi:hypothetical protein BpHYR1_009349 [Brachionus plicatilis]|uniref:Uncharacterized protein n=1 Tax=Brachionus plicatilis TaxID=10195 RepID=A0A3M7SXC3_BRAPC|nr:hypothetical protein BpHYR1_009349 [Brachionus plicatilis]
MFMTSLAANYTPECHYILNFKHLPHTSLVIIPCFYSYYLVEHSSFNNLKKIKKKNKIFCEERLTSRYWQYKALLLNY